MSHTGEVDALTRQIGNMSVASDTSANRRSSNTIPYVSLRDAAETILPFDGKNMPVSQFANSCLHAKNMVSPGAEYGLVQMIKNKLVGSALRVALSGEYNDIESLLAVIKTRFAPVYSSSQLHGELSKVTQYPDESVVDYGSRVSMLLQQLKSCYQTKNPNQAIQFINSAEANAIKNFLGLKTGTGTGLKIDIYTRLYSRDPVSLNHAIESAIKAEAEYNEHAQRMKITEGLMQLIRCNNCLGYGHNAYSCSTINPLAQVTHVQWQPKVCTLCKNSGHTRAECRTPQSRGLNYRNTPINNMNRNMNYNQVNRQNHTAPRNFNLVCRYCKIPGHSIEQCRKRQYNNDPRNQLTRSNNRETRIREGQGNRERVQRNGAMLNEHPRVRLVTPEQKRRSTRINLACKIGKPSSVILPSKDLIEERANFMIDTDSDINLIKKNSLYEKMLIDYKVVFELSGITKGRTRTLGVVKIRIFITDTLFHVVPDDFPIQQNGILGTEFFKNQRATIDYPRASLVVNGIPYYFHNDETVMIPARTRKQIFIRVDPEIKNGYVPKLDAGPQVYLGNAVVSNHHGIAYLYVINSSDEDIKLAIPTVKLYPFEKTKNNKEIKEINESESRDLESRVDKILQLLRLDHLNEEERVNVINLVTKNKERFHLPGEALGATNVLKHRIFTNDDRPINVKQYRYPQVHKEEIQRQIGEMLEKGVIEPSSSPYNSPLWIVPKKDDSLGNKKWRLVIDFRALNEKTVGDAYPLPNIVDILDQLGSAKYFSIFDLASGFHQILMDKDDKHKTAFSTPYGHFEYNRMPFGLKNAPATFQRLMDQVLTGLQGIELFVYLDDIVIYARSLEEHEIKFQRLMKRLSEANLFLQPDKCEFLKREVAYLGHIITENGVRPDPKKIMAVKNFPTPKTRKNIKQFLGLAGYYRRFIENFSKIAKPLSDLTKQSNTFEWKEEQQEAFDKLREVLCSEPILQYPNFNEPFIITTDASGYAIGVILSQGKKGSDLPIAYASRILNNAEPRYSPTERELLFSSLHLRS